MDSAATDVKSLVLMFEQLNRIKSTPPIASITTETESETESETEIQSHPDEYGADENDSENIQPLPRSASQLSESHTSSQQSSEQQPESPTLTLPPLAPPLPAPPALIASRPPSARKPPLPANAPVLTPLDGNSLLLRRRVRRVPATKISSKRVRPMVVLQQQQQQQQQQRQVQQQQVGQTMMMRRNAKKSVHFPVPTHSLRTYTRNMTSQVAELTALRNRLLVMSTERNLLKNRRGSADGHSDES